MKVRTLCLSIAALVSSMVALPTFATEASPAPQATPASGTHDTRKAERKKNRAAMSEANKKGQVPQNTEASTAPAATPASGTSDTRKAERKQNRAELTKENKAGQLPQTNEAGEVKK
jgi:hypothetical protein